MSARRVALLALPAVIGTASLLATSALPAASAAEPRAGRAFTVMADFQTLNIFVTSPGSVAAGDIRINLAAEGLWISVDPDSGGAPMLSAGSGCTEMVPKAQDSSSYPSGTSIVCTVSRDIFIDVTASTYTGGELVFASNVQQPVSFNGSPYDDQFYGGPGSDSIDGAGGHDVLFGGPGDDWIIGGDGADEIDGEEGQDVIYGDAGPDDITVDGDAKAADWVNCNNFDPAVAGTNNDPANPPINQVSYNKGVDRITDCGIPGAPNNSEPPAFTGTAVVGTPYAASAGTWTPAKGLIMSYAWFACPKAEEPIPFSDEEPGGNCAAVFAKDGQAGLTYTPKTGDVGKFLVLRSTARNNSGYGIEVTRSSSAVLAKQTAGAPTGVKAWVSQGRVRGRVAYFLNSSWTAPTSVGAGPIQEYWTQCSSDGGKTWGLTIKVPGTFTTARSSSSSSSKTAYSGYTCRVAAVNMTRQPGDWSKTVNVTQL